MSLPQEEIPPRSFLNEAGLESGMGSFDLNDIFTVSTGIISLLVVVVVVVVGCNGFGIICLNLAEILTRISGVSLHFRVYSMVTLDVGDNGSVASIVEAI